MTEIHSETKQPRVLGQASSQAEERPLIADLVQRVRGSRFVRRLRVMDLIIIGVFIAAVIGGALFLVRQATLNHESTDARSVTDQVVADIARQDTAAIRRLGTKQFQSDFDKANLSSQLQQFAAVYKDVKPAVDGRVISNSSKRQYAAITYRYDLLKIPFYIRVDVVKPAGSTQWQVQAISTGHQSAPDDGTNQTTNAQSV